MRWKVFHYLNPVTAAEKETFGFKTRNCPPVVEEMKSFEEGMIHIIQKISFKGTQSQFQEGQGSKLKKSSGRLLATTGEL